jgi:hypothetical protein
MFTAQQHRAKAAEYRGFLDAPLSLGETSEFRNRERTYKTLAENEEWLALNANKILASSDYEIGPALKDVQDKRVVRVRDDERILRCLAAWRL